MTNYTIKIPATSANLGPGYDVIGMALEVYNTFEIIPGIRERVKIDVSGEGAGKDGKTGELPTDETNLFYRAVVEGCRIAGIDVPNMYIHLHNEIPLNRGMGSSATAVLGGLLLAGELSSGKLDEETLLQTAVELEGHPDNLMAAYYGGVVINYKESGKYRGIPFIPPLPLKAVLVIPDIQVSTKKARELLPKNYPIGDVVTNLRNISLLTFALQSGKYELLGNAMDDTIHTPYRAELIPGFFEAAEAAKKAGAFGCAISGSGSTLIALCDRNEQEIVDKMAVIFRNRSIECKSVITGISIAGSTIL